MSGVTSRRTTTRILRVWTGVVIVSDGFGSGTRRQVSTAGTGRCSAVGRYLVPVDDTTRGLVGLEEAYTA